MLFLRAGCELAMRRCFSSSAFSSAALASNWKLNLEALEAACLGVEDKADFEWPTAEASFSTSRGGLDGDWNAIAA
jgi:hypothetical protein